MIAKINHFLESLPMTIVSGIFLLLSIICIFTRYKPLIDPAWASIIISGIPLLYLAITRLIYEKWISSALLIVIAMIASLVIGQIFAAGEVVFIMALGALLEDYTVERSKKGLNKLIQLKPQNGRIIINNNGQNKEKIVPIENIKINDTVRILPGETIPVDGIIINGNTSIDQSIMTGESLPVDKTIKDEVYCGTINKYGTIDIQATNIGKDSSLEKLITMVKEADEKQAPTQRIADQWATWLVPVALLIAIIAYIVTWDISRAVTVLVVFCPCALILATPTAIMAAIGQATKHGILIKSGEALEKMGNITTITFDKTGTLTKGNLEVSDIIPMDEDYSKTDLMSLISSAEIKSEHPLAKAIINYSKNNNIHYNEPETFEMIPGKGIKATINNQIIQCGTSTYLKENNITLNDKNKTSLNKLTSEGKASILISNSNKIIGLIGLSDTIRNNAKNIITKLYEMDTNVELLTGDNLEAANYFSKKVGIKNIHSNLLPEDKVKEIESIKNSGKTVCMIGDGVNDAPALKTADVAVAMGTIGSDIAIDASDIALLSDEIEKIPYLKKLSNATLFTIHLSITISMLINTLAIILSVLGVLNPVTGALVHNIGSCFVVILAASLYDRNFSDSLNYSDQITKTNNSPTISK